VRIATDEAYPPHNRVRESASRVNGCDAMPKLDDQISTLQQRLQQLKLRQQRIDARKRAIAATRDRKAETRRKILVGTLVLEKIQRGEMDKNKLLTWLDEALTRAADRVLFDLGRRPTGEAQTPPSVERDDRNRIR
jgi:hypothetical protein